MVAVAIIILVPATDSQGWGTFIGYQPTRTFNLETAYKFNIGTDLRLAKSVDVNVDVYYQLRDDISAFW